MEKAGLKENVIIAQNHISTEIDANYQVSTIAGKVFKVHTVQIDLRSLMHSKIANRKMQACIVDIFKNISIVPPVLYQMLGLIGNRRNWQDV